MESTANCAEIKTDSERVVLHMILHEILFFSIFAFVIVAVQSVCKKISKVIKADKSVVTDATI